MLGSAREEILAAESQWRRDHLPAPARNGPRADADALATVRDLERLAGEVGALIGQIASQPVPEGDRMTQRHRGEAETLARLIQCDTQMVGQAEMLRATVDGRGPAEVVANATTLKSGLAALRQTLRQRAAILA